jgi:hypothetical protein
MMATAAPQQRAAQLTSLGLTAEVAEQLASAYNDTMGRCILALYRSAAQPVMAELGHKLPAAAQRPGLAVLATEDHYVGTEQMRRNERAPGLRCSRASVTGGWYEIPRAVPMC